MLKKKIKPPNKRHKEYKKQHQKQTTGIFKWQSNEPCQQKVCYKNTGTVYRNIKTE